MNVTPPYKCQSLLSPTVHAKHVAEHYFTSRCTVCQNALEVALFCCGNWAAVLQYTDSVQQLYVGSSVTALVIGLAI